MRKSASGGVKRAAPPPKTGEAVECCSKDQSTAQLHIHSSMSVMKRHPSTTWTSLTNMPKEIASYAIDQPVYTDVKARDIQLHGTNESLDPFQRAILCLKSDVPSEKIFVATVTPQLILKDREKYFREILPGLEKELKLDSGGYEEVHAAAATGFATAYKTLAAKNPENAKYVLQLMFRSMESKNPDVSEAWSTAILEVIDSTAPKDLEKFHAEALGKSKSPLAHVRTAVTLMIRQLIVRSPASAKALTPIIGVLLEDPVALVRGTMCQQLGPIYHSLPSKEGLSNHINRIYKDNDPFVKKSLVITIGSIYKFPDMKPLHDLILGLLKRTVKEAFVQGNLDILLEFTSYIGEMAKVLTEAGSLTADYKLWFLDAFIHLARFGLSTQVTTDESLPTGFINFRANMGYNRRHSLVESMVSSGVPQNAVNKKLIAERGWGIRKNTAKEFLSFFKFSKPLVDFKLGLQPLIGNLIHDPNESVRAAMSNNFWPVMETLGNVGHLLHGEFVYILSDDSLEVVEGIAPHVGKILKVLANGKIISTEQPTQSLVEIGGALIFCEERLSQSNAWRVHTQFLSQLTVLPFCLPGDYIYNNFVPNLFHRLLHLRHLPARIGVADAIVCFLRYCRRAKQREEIRNRIKESFAKGKSVQDRMLFLYMSRKIIDTFSRKYFREHFFDQTLQMADDAVSNVRMKVSTMMPDMKNTLQRSEDDKLLQKLEDTALRLRESETDRDVLSAIDEAMAAMKKIGIRFAGDKAPKTKADAEDEAKEKEEIYVESLEPAQPISGQPEKDKGYFKTPKAVAPTYQRKVSIPEETSLISLQELRKAPAPPAPVAAEELPEKHRFRRRTYVTGEIVAPTSAIGAQPQLKKK